ncbi:MAG: NAD-dependent epimerase/dehydratase family protein [Candidatus Velthaea sp.]
MIELKRVAVTGAGGFIGTAVCRTLLNLGCEIHALVGPPGDVLEAPAGVTVALWGAISDALVLAPLIEGVDAVVHLAGPPSVRASFDDPVGYVNAHTGGTAAVLETCRSMGIGQFVYVSSAEVYGRPRTDPVEESHPLDARSPYAAAKVGAEQLVRAFDHAYGTCSAIVRPFSVYGPRMGAHALLPAILRQLGSSGPLRLADLRPERDYCHVDDVARAIVGAARTPHRGTVALNAGSGIGTSVRELAETALRLAGLERSLEEDVAGRRPGQSDILRLVADRRLASQMLGWEPQISLETGVREMLSAYTSPA